MNRIEESDAVKALRRKITRRRFVQLIGGGIGAALVARCAPPVPQPTPVPAVERDSIERFTELNSRGEGRIPGLEHPDDTLLTRGSVTYRQHILAAPARFDNAADKTGRLNQHGPAGTKIGL